MSENAGTDAHRVTHLQLVQAVITRMGQNSFTVRGWSVTLVSVVFALIAARDASSLAALIALVPAVVFWGLDAYYLRQERLFRRLYQAVVADLSEATARVPVLSMDIGPYTATVPTWRTTLFSRTVAPIPAVLAAIAAGYTLTATLL